MDFSLDSSVVLAAVVGLWLVWIAPFFLRRARSAGTSAGARRAPTQPVHQDPLSENSTQKGRSQGSTMDLKATGQNGNAYQGRGPLNGSTAVSVTPAAHRRETELPALNVRYGRLALALAGILGLLGAASTLPLAAFGAVSATWPVLLGLVAASAVALLRTLAVRDRRKRINRAFAEAMWPQPAAHTGLGTVPSAPPKDIPRVGQERETALFDAEQSTPGIAAELHPAAPACAGGSVYSGFSEGPPETEPPADRPDEDLTVRRDDGGVSGEAGRSTWQPVDVPRPIYVDAAKAERSAPAPLELPVAPKPSGRTSFKESAATLAEKSPSRSGGPVAASPAGKINLDDILQRRRA